MCISLFQVPVNWRSTIHTPKSSHPQLTHTHKFTVKRRKKLPRTSRRASFPRADLIPPPFTEMAHHFCYWFIQSVLIYDIFLSRPVWLGEPSQGRDPLHCFCVRIWPQTCISWAPGSQAYVQQLSICYLFLYLYSANIQFLKNLFFSLCECHRISAGRWGIYLEKKKWPARTKIFCTGPTKAAVERLD